jgi:hypothetical protein
MKKLIFALLICITFTGLVSCKKDRTEINYSPGVVSSKDYVRAEDAMFEIVNTYFKGILDTLVIEHCYGYIDNCEICWYPQDSLLTFGYGSVDRMCQDNKFRRGSFYAKFDGQKWDEGVTAWITTEQLYVDDSLVEAKMEITNNGLNNSNFQEYALKVDYCIYKLQDSLKINPVVMSSDLTMQWIEGSSTPAVHEDDAYLISGTASGTSSDGYAFTVQIQDPLTDYVDCFWLEKGLSTIDVPASDYPDGEIDYVTDDGCADLLHFYFNNNLFYDIIK